MQRVAPRTQREGPGLHYLISGKVDEKATQLHAIASLKVLLDATKPQDGVNGNADGLHSAEGGDSGRATGSEVFFDLSVVLSLEVFFFVPKKFKFSSSH